MGTPNRLSYGERGLLSPPVRTATQSVCSVMTVDSVKSLNENFDKNRSSRQRFKGTRSDKVMPLKNVPHDERHNFSSPLTVENL